MRKLIFLLCVGLSTVASAEGSSSDLLGFKWGVGFGMTRLGHQLMADFATPKFASWGPNDRANLSAYFELGILTIKDAYLANRKLQDASNLSLTAGLRIVNKHSEFLQSYGKVGLREIFLDDDIKYADNSALSSGLVLAIGADIIASTSGHYAMEGSGISFFAEAQYSFFHKRMDSITGEPDYFNGIGMVIGSRYHY